MKCGQFGEVGDGQWGVLDCLDNRGIEGNYVEVTVPAANLQIAEIQILGEGYIQSWNRAELVSISVENGVSELIHFTKICRCFRTIDRAKPARFKFWFHRTISIFKNARIITLILFALPATLSFFEILVIGPHKLLKFRS